MMTQHIKHAGFSLIELMIAVAIVGILAAIAYPTYIDKVRSARRVDAKSLVLQAANRQEQLYASNGNRYLDTMSGLGLPPVTENGFYGVAVKSPDAGKQTFTITASAQNDQVRDQCRVLTLDQTGAKKAWTGATAGTGTDVSRACW